MAPNFTSRRGLALGIAACGSATGGLVYSVIVRQLIPAVGFPWTMRVIALVQLGTLAMANMCLRPHAISKKYTGWVDWSAFRDARYNYYAVASFLSLFSLYFSFFFIAEYSRVAISPPLTYQASLNLVLVLNSVSVIGRLGSGYAAGRLGTLTVYIPVAGATAITLFSWIGVKTVTGTYIWTIVCGIFSGGVQSLFPAGLSSDTNDDMVIDPGDMLDLEMFQLWAWQTKTRNQKMPLQS
ncbi:hypothetical protein CEP53_006547 [Fusarium sp. AF-6]|nr:hypothetical protein CEP53_006547 [Fusarium sp. AF-6]